MAKLLWAITCRRVITDSETNLISYIDAVNGFQVSRLPAPFPVIMVGSVWEGEEGQTLEARFRLVAPSGEDAYEFEFPPHTFTSPRHRTNMRFGGFHVEEEGRYQVLLEEHHEGEWKVAGSLPLAIELLESEGEEESEEEEE